MLRFGLCTAGKFWAAPGPADRRPTRSPRRCGWACPGPLAPSVCSSMRCYCWSDGYSADVCMYVCIKQMNKLCNRIHAAAVLLSCALLWLSVHATCWPLPTPLVAGQPHPVARQRGTKEAQSHWRNAAVPWRQAPQQQAAHPHGLMHMSCCAVDMPICTCKPAPPTHLGKLVLVGIKQLLQRYHVLLMVLVHSAKANEGLIR